MSIEVVFAFRNILQADKTYMYYVDDVNFYADETNIEAAGLLKTINENGQRDHIGKTTLPQYYRWMAVYVWRRSLRENTRNDDMVLYFIRGRQSYLNRTLVPRRMNQAWKRCSSSECPITGVDSNQFESQVLWF